MQITATGANNKQGNQLRHDLNSVIGTGKNWSLPSFWAPVLRYISGPILFIILSLAYPSFAEVTRDPLHIMGFIIGHFLLVWVVVGFFMPQWFGVFIVPERLDDWKQPMAPGELRGTADNAGADSLESVISNDRGNESGEKRQSP